LLATASAARRSDSITDSCSSGDARMSSSRSDRLLSAVTHELLINQRGRSKELAPIDLAAEADIAALVKTVDLEELGAEA
jgi:hypothetical protein